MSDSAALELTCKLLADRYEDLGREAAQRLRHWFSGQVPYAYVEILEKHLGEEHIDLIFDSFWQVLPFGTGGRRGPVGYGSNRMNPTTVAMTDADAAPRTPQPSPSTKTASRPMLVMFASTPATIGLRLSPPP